MIDLTPENQTNAQIKSGVENTAKDRRETVKDDSAMTTSNMERGPIGIAVVDKEPGWTSHDAVARCRRIFGQRRVGHAGTLDPDASGILLIGVGRATRLLRFLTALPKTYEAEVVFGTATSTLDASGEVTGEWDMDYLRIEDVRLAATQLTGDIDQVPPMVSAVKVGGKPLYKLARQGLDIPRQPRPVSVYRFDITEAISPGVFKIEVECSSGTYVRVLASDLGELLNGGAHLRSLRRTRIGSFCESDAKRLDELDASALLSPAEGLRDLDSVVVDSEIVNLIARGLPLDRVPVGASGDGPWALLDTLGQLLAVYEATDSDRITPAVVLSGH